MRAADKDRKGNAAGNKRSKKQPPATDEEAAEQSAQPTEADAQPPQPLHQQAEKLPVVLDLLTPNDLLKKSSANRAKQLQVPAHAESAATDGLEAAKPAPAGKKVASRGRNANLQVVDIEPKPKQGKRKATAAQAAQLATELPTEAHTVQNQVEHDATLPNKKRAKQSKSAAAQPVIAEYAQLDEAAIETVLREVPGLPGVTHRMPQAAATKVAPLAEPADLLQQSHKAAAPSNRCAPDSGAGSQQPAPVAAAQSSPTAVAVKVVTDSAAQQDGPVAQAHTVDKPADRAVPAAQRDMLAMGASAQADQFQILQVGHAYTC